MNFIVDFFEIDLLEAKILENPLEVEFLLQTVLPGQRNKVRGRDIKLRDIDDLMLDLTSFRLENTAIPIKTAISPTEIPIIFCRTESLTGRFLLGLVASMFCTGMLFIVKPTPPLQ